MVEQAKKKDNKRDNSRGGRNFIRNKKDERLINADPNAQVLQDKVVFINRCAKVVKGGRRFSFSALVVAGDCKGKVGYGFGKANEVSESIRKATAVAKKSLVSVTLKGDTIAYKVLGKYLAGKVLLRPAAPGTGVIAGGGVRAVLELAGVKDILTKSLGSSSPLNVVKATLNGLQQLRSAEEIYRDRGKVYESK